MFYLLFHLQRSRLLKKNNKLTQSHDNTIVIIMHNVLLLGRPYSLRTLPVPTHVLTFDRDFSGAWRFLQSRLMPKSVRHNFLNQSRETLAVRVVQADFVVCLLYDRTAFLPSSSPTMSSLWPCFICVLVSPLSTGRGEIGASCARNYSENLAECARNQM